MSCKVDIENLSDEVRERIENELEIELEESKYGRGMGPKIIQPYDLVGNDVYLPFAYGHRILQLPVPERSSFPSISIESTVKPREAQQILIEEARTELSKRKSVIISAHTGFGKTFCARELARIIRLKTLVIVNKVVLMKQWKASILKFSPDARVQLLTAKSKKEDSDFYVMNALNIPKRGHGFFDDIGLVIVDECHVIMAALLSQSLQYVQPRYLIGLSATPYRPDGLDVLLELYFGKCKLVRKLYKKHTVYHVNTGFTPEIKLAKNGKVNWGAILDFQANNPERNKLIVDIITSHPDRTFLVLTKRLAQGEILLQALKEKGETVTSLLGKEQEFDESARILIGTSQKVGFGFDHAKLDALLLAGDLEEYFIQYLGRVFRREDVEPVIFDLVDNNGILRKHFATRKAVYMEHGGRIKQYRPRLL